MRIKAVAVATERDGPCAPCGACRQVIFEFGPDALILFRGQTGPRRMAITTAGRAAPITAIIGTAGDRPDDTLRGIGRIAAERAQRVAIKQTLGTCADGPPSRSSAS